MTMELTLYIPLYRTFLNWIISVILGSVLWPCIYWFFDRTEVHLDDAGGIVLISIIISGLFSLPAMLILLFASWKLNKQYLIPKVYVQIHVAAHLLVALLTFFVIYVLTTTGIGSKGLIYLVVASTYTAVGLTTWFVTFSIYKRKAKDVYLQQTELLDDAQNQSTTGVN